VAVLPNSGEPAAGAGRARAGNDPRVPRGSIPVLGLGSGVTGKQAHWRPAARAFAGPAVAPGWRVQGKAWL
jgi:hypothetical protein